MVLWRKARVVRTEREGLSNHWLVDVPSEENVVIGDMQKRKIILSIR